MGFFCLTILSIMFAMVSSSGRIYEPISRASAWRVEPSLPKNTNDDKMNCGGAKNQWENNNGKCGICGDPWEVPQPRPHEGGGRFSNNYITGRYNEGQVIQVYVSLTNNRMGWFEFRVCPHNDYTTPVTQECLDQHLLFLEGTSITRYWVPETSQPDWSKSLYLQLPRGLYCRDQCVLQWKYQTETIPEDCSDCEGKDQFYACSDITIQPLPTTTTPMPTTTTTTTPMYISTTSTTPTKMTTTPPTSTHVADTTTNTPASISTSKSEGPTTITSPMSSTTNPTTLTRTLPITTTTKPVISTTAGTKCYATEDWKDVSGPDMTMDEWCALNCPLGNCPPHMCVCTDNTNPTSEIPEECTATKEWEHIEEMNKWCRINCNRGHCPADYCTCPHDHPSPSTATTTVDPEWPGQGPHIICLPKKEWRLDPKVWRFCWTQCSYMFCNKELCDCRIFSWKTSTVTIQKSTASNVMSSITPGASKLSQLLRRGRCWAVGSWSNSWDLHNWCRVNCGVRGDCPDYLCHCR